MAPISSRSYVVLRRSDQIRPGSLAEALELAGGAFPLVEAEQRQRLAEEILSGRLLVGRSVGPQPCDQAPTLDLARFAAAMAHSS